MRVPDAIRKNSVKNCIMPMALVAAGRLYKPERGEERGSTEVDPEQYKVYSALLAVGRWPSPSSDPSSVWCDGASDAAYLEDV